MTTSEKYFFKPGMKDMTSIFYISLLLVVSLLGAGCSAIKAYPERPVPADIQLKNLEWCFDYKKIQTPDPITLDPTTWRDSVINCRIYAIDLNFTIFEQSIARDNISLNTGADLAVIGLGGATAVVGNGATKSILGAISGGITGAKGGIDKDVFYSKTMPALLAQMEAQRKSQLVIIRNGQQNKADKYPLSEAIIDVENYYKAGSIPAALQGITNDAGVQKNNADNDIKNIYRAKYDQGATRPIRDRINRWLDSNLKENISKLKTWLQKQTPPIKMSPSTWVDDSATPQTMLEKAITENIIPE
ncbi:MAG: hypothetical protein RW306_02825 [Geobacteraceae bacterium]|nr:hypothetical protein [Geobacteraceae bacterium]